MRVALDTNVLAYAEGVNGSVLKKDGLEIIKKLSIDSTFIPIQVLGELYRVLLRKAGRAPDRARAAVLSWYDLFPQIETSASVLLAAIDLATDHNLSIWDAIILSASSAAGCRLLLSQDLQEGFTWNGVTVVDPFAARRHPLLEALLS